MQIKICCFADSNQGWVRTYEKYDNNMRLKDNISWGSRRLTTKVTLQIFNDRSYSISFVN